MKKKIFSMLALGLALFACSPEEEIKKDVYITVDPTAIEAGYATEETSVAVDANETWTLARTDGTGAEIDWVKVDRVSGSGPATVNLRILENPSRDERTAVFTFSAGTASAFLDIRQEGNPDAVEEPDPEPEPDPDPEYEGYDFPIVQIWETDIPISAAGAAEMDMTNLTNATVDGNVITFEDGMSIEMVSSSVSYAFACPAHTNPKANAGFQTGIYAYIGESASGYWLIKIPVKNELYGALKYFYGSRRESAKDSKYEWSTDEGATWNDFTTGKTAGVSEAMWATGSFEIPESQKVQAGGWLWIRHNVVDNGSKGNVSLSNGICIIPAEAELSELPAEDNASVVFSEGFDDTVGANSMYIDLPVGFMKSLTPTKWNASYVPVNDFTEVVNCHAKPGFLQVGHTDEAFPDRMAKGSYTINVGARLAEMGKTSADLKVTFKCAGIINAFTDPVNTEVILLVNGGGSSADGVIANADLSMDEFKEYTMNVKGAVKDTRLVLTCADITDKGAVSGYTDYRFFIDDIVITIE